ncbi:RTA1-domain-containing protein [Aureobasidium sp. EXF-12298]|nr:RTA1-domain-containing protein [Aureobasidium sp. EXF-12298]KAI4754397.1 RTA1-domain-containing protein [Aureobasidium sp. EXF-12344]KAI4781049.1 RTA1-domain-containing protein [Aureobasidium sp. EXF-3400]
MSDSGTQYGDFKLYRYDPSMAAAVIFILAFIVITALHFYQVVRTKTYFFAPFVIGGLFEVIGYIGRAVSSEEAPDFSIPAYSIQAILILVAPALFAASIYMELGRIILLTDGEQHSIIPSKWLTKIFVIGDVISFCLQAAGGGIMASGTLQALENGEHITIAGLVIQILFFGFFIIVSITFNIRMARVPTSRSMINSNPWKKHLYTLYGGSALILIRSVFRLIEYAQGNDGYLISHEWFLYIFDACLMLATMVLFAWYHPSEIWAMLNKNGGKMVNHGYKIEAAIPMM